MEKGYFKKSTVPVKDADGKVVLDHEEFPRANTTLEGLAKLEPSFAGTHPNAGGYRMKDGPLTFDQKAKTALSAGRGASTTSTRRATPAESSTAPAWCCLASPEYAKAHGLKPRARIRRQPPTATSRSSC